MTRVSASTARDISSSGVFLKIASGVVSRDSIVWENGRMRKRSGRRTSARIRPAAFLEIPPQVMFCAQKLICSTVYTRPCEESSLPRGLMLHH